METKYFLLKMAPFLLIVAGIIFAILGFGNFECISSNAQEVFQWIANFLIVGVIFGFMSSYIQFKGAYQEDLENVIYNPRFLKIRKDIENVQVNVSKIFFDSKFPKSNGSNAEACEIVKDFFPIKWSYYCENMHLKITIKWSDKSKYIIEIIQEEEYDILPTNRDRFEYTNLYTAPISEKEEESCTFKIDNYSVNGEDRLNSMTMEEVVETTGNNKKKGFKYHHVKVTLEGSEKYKIKRQFTKKQSLQEDPYIGYTVRTLLNNIRIQVFNEAKEDIDLTYVERGILRNYDSCINNKDGYLEYDYKCILLKKQGLAIITTIK